MKSNTENSFRDKWEMNSTSFLKDVLQEGSNTQNWILNRNGFRNLSDFKKFLSNYGGELFINDCFDLCLTLPIKLFIYMQSTKRFYNKFLNPLMIICFKLKIFLM